MASPFPGMDPFLENPAYWADFHSRFVNCWCEAIADALPANYEASLGDRVYLVEHDPEVRKLGYPDVAITQADVRPPAAPPQSGGIATLEPVTVPLQILEGPRETYVEILHLPERSLVTVLELLSPANKEQPGRTEYLAKRRALLFQSVHLVELDFLHGGRRLPMERPLPVGDCYYFVSRAELRPDCQVYCWPLAHVLPRLPVPLRAPDADLLIDLAAVFRSAYDRGHFAHRLPYRGPSPGHLDAQEQEWARTVLAAEGRT